MRKFLIRIGCSVLITLVLLVFIFLWTDPFKTLHEFTLEDVNEVNREYVSMELFLKNYENEKYNSFIFGSSRTSAINTYQWKKYLPEDAKQFLFQAWVETITGIYQKLKFLDNNNVEINNVLIFIDIPSSFSYNQKSTEAMTIKHYKLSNRSKFYYNLMLFKNFIQKPSFIYKHIKKKIFNKKDIANFDIISNDWNPNNKNLVPPVQDKSIDRTKFPINITEKEFDKLIEGDFVKILEDIAEVFKRRETSYKIILPPQYMQYKINHVDLNTLKTIFGSESIYDYSGKNDIAVDINNFTDYNHFGPEIGWRLIEDIYSN